jgi:hypothetical protein
MGDWWVPDGARWDPSEAREGPLGSHQGFGRFPAGFGNENPTDRHETLSPVGSQQGVGVLRWGPVSSQQEPMGGFPAGVWWVPSGGLKGSQGGSEGLQQSPVCSQPDTLGSQLGLVGFQLD